MWKSKQPYLLSKQNTQGHFRDNGCTMTNKDKTKFPVRWEKTSKTTKFNLQWNGTMPTSHITMFHVFSGFEHFHCLGILLQCITTLSLVLPGRRGQPPPCYNLLLGTYRKQWNCSSWASNRRRHIRTGIYTSSWPHSEFPKPSPYLFFIDNVAKRKKISLWTDFKSASRKGQEW